MVRKRTASILVAIVALALLGAYFGGFLGTVVGANTTSQFATIQGLKFGGVYDSPKELLDSSGYIAAWTDVDRSEKIAADLTVCKDGITGWAIINAPNGVGFNPDGSTFNRPDLVGSAVVHYIALNGKLIKADGFKFALSADLAIGDCPGAVLGREPARLPGPVSTFLTGSETGIMTNDVYAFTYDSSIIGGGSGSGRWRWVAHDEANIWPGAGSCEIVFKNDRPYKPGESFDVSCNLGYASSVADPAAGRGWFLYGSWQTAALANLGNGPAFAKRVTLVAPSAAGIYTIQLVNSVFLKSASTLTVTVNPEQAPPMPKVTVDPPTPWTTGQTVTVSWTAGVNSATKSPIKEVTVRIFYANGELIREGLFTGDKGSTSFGPIGKDTDIKVAVISQDQNGEFSVPNENTYNVEGCDAYNKCGGGGGSGGGEGFVFPIWLALVIAAAIAILLVIFIPFLPLWPWKVIIALVAVILILAAILIFPW